MPESSLLVDALDELDDVEEVDGRNSPLVCSVWQGGLMELAESVLELVGVALLPSHLEPGRNPLRCCRFDCRIILDPAENRPEPAGRHSGAACELGSSSALQSVAEDDENADHSAVYLQQSAERFLRAA